MGLVGYHSLTSDGDKSRRRAKPQAELRRGWHLKIAGGFPIVLTIRVQVSKWWLWPKKL